MDTLSPDSHRQRAVRTADELCRKRGQRLTILRRQIFELVWQANKPIGAYAVMDLLQKTSERKKVAPPTVYRTLDFLVAQGLVHKVHSLNAFFACSNPLQAQCDALFICTDCGFTEEVPNNTIQQAINLSANEQKFTVQDQVLEIRGHCTQCRQQHKNQQ